MNGRPEDQDSEEEAEERRLAALYGLSEPPPDDEGRNPFWWIWVFVVPFMLLATSLLLWRVMTIPQRTLPGL